MIGNTPCSVGKSKFVKLLNFNFKNNFDLFLRRIWGQMLQVCKSLKVRWESLLTDCIFREKTKTTIFEKGQFSGHFVFDKNNCFWRKQFCYPDKQEFFFWKKMFFWKCFSKKLKKKFHKFLCHQTATIIKNFTFFRQFFLPL